MGTIWYPLGTQAQGRGGWWLEAGGWARRPDAGSDPASNGCFCFASPWAKAAGAVLSYSWFLLHQGSKKV